MENALEILAKHAGEIVQIMDTHPGGALLLIILIWLLTKKPPPGQI